MSWLYAWVGYATGSFFSNIVGRVSPAVNWVYGVLTNPYFIAIIFVLVALSLVPGTEN